MIDWHEPYDDIEPVRPYLWLGEEQDAHVQDWRVVRDTRQRDFAMLIAAASYESSMNVHGGLTMAQLQNNVNHSLRGMSYLGNFLAQGIGVGSGFLK